LGEKLDGHRKERQALHPGLTLTGMYNVLEKLRAGEPLSDKDRKIHEEGLVSILKQIHDDLDAAVLKAYGWEDLSEWRSPERHPQPVSMESGVLENATPEQELLTRLVVLNHERAAEEANGLVRWLRPEYQAPEEAKVSQPKQDEMGLDTGTITAVTKIFTSEKLNWPKTIAAQFSEVSKLLPATGANPKTISACFGKKSKPREAQIEEILETLRSLGKLE